MKVAFLGLGVMRFPMAGHIAKRFHQVTVFNRTQQKARNWVEQHRGTMSETVSEAVSGADVVLMCLGNDHDVREVALGDDGVVCRLKAGSILVDHTTVSADLAVELAGHCREVGAGFLDAPVSGGQSGAEEARLTIMAGGKNADLKKVQPVLETYGKQISLIGDHGSGQKAKMVNQMCIAGILQGLSEGLLLAEKAGLDAGAVLEAISGGAASSWQMVNRGETMMERKYDFGFALDWMVKDLEICLKEAERLNSPVNLTREVCERYRELQKKGYGRWDTSALIESLRA